MKEDLFQPVTADACTFYHSWRQHALGPLPAALGFGPGGSLWAAALDLQIEEPIMRKILDYSEPAHFFHAYRIYVNLNVLLTVCPRGPLASRARRLIANCTGQLHPITFNN